MSECLFSCFESANFCKIFEKRLYILSNNNWLLENLILSFFYTTYIFLIYHFIKFRCTFLVKHITATYKKINEANLERSQKLRRSARKRPSKMTFRTSPISPSLKTLAVRFGRPLRIRRGHDRGFVSSKLKLDKKIVFGVRLTIEATVFALQPKIFTGKLENPKRPNIEKN